MQTYLVIITTILVFTQIIRIIQNAISLIRQERQIKEQIAWVHGVKLTEKDFENQKIVWELWRKWLEKECEDE